MDQTIEKRIMKLEREIIDRQEEIHRLRWALRTSGNPSSWFNDAMSCTMPQGHPSHCGCEW